MKGASVTEQLDYTLDITAEVCPLTFVKTKLLIEKMRPGQVAEVRLKGAEPLGNVPRSVGELGHEILSMIAEDGEPATGIHRLRIRKV